MNQIVKSIVIDVAKKNKIQKIIAKQKDNKTRFVNATITNEGKQIIVNSNAIVCVNGLREDGERKSFQGEVNENGTVTVPITYWMLELEGLVECDISIMGVDEEMLTTTSFKISVEKTSRADDEISKDENYDLLLSLIKNVTNIKAETVDKAVKEWLGDHPEATTTVQNKSLTEEKLTDELKRKAIRSYLTPDDFEGTDSEKLTKCFETLAISGGVIHIERQMTLDSNITITHDSNDNNRITVKGIGQNASIVTKGYSFVGSKRACGGVVFENINFSGTGILIDGATLIRIQFNSCTFDGFSYIVKSLDKYIQSIYITNCLIRNVSEYILCTSGDIESYLYDTKVIGNIIEWGGGVANCVSAQGCIFSHNCIEGMKKDLFYFPKVINQVTIDGNYFESNEGRLIDIGDGLEYTTQCITISNNNFFCLQETDDVFIVLPKVVRNGSIIISGNNVRIWSTATFVQSNATIPLTNVIYIGNTGNLVDPNGTVTVVENTLAQLKSNDSIVGHPNGNSVNTYTGYVTLSAINSSMCYGVITLPFIAKNTEYTVEFSNISIVDIGPVESIEVSQKSTTSVWITLKKENSFTKGFSYFSPYTLKITL